MSIVPLALVIYNVLCVNPKLQGGIQERLTFLESRLAEEKDWRKRLEVDLAVAQSSLKKEKQVLLHNSPSL